MRVLAEIVGAPIPGEERAFSGGPRLQEKLGLAGEPHVSQIDVWASENLMVSAGPMDVNCPQCGAEVEEWGDLVSEFCEGGSEPDYRCPDCGTSTPATKLLY